MSSFEPISVESDLPALRERLRADHPDYLAAFDLKSGLVLQAMLRVRVENPMPPRVRLAPPGEDRDYVALEYGPYFWLWATRTGGDWTLSNLWTLGTGKATAPTSAPADAMKASLALAQRAREAAAAPPAAPPTPPAPEDSYQDRLAALYRSAREASAADSMRAQDAVEDAVGDVLGDRRSDVYRAPSGVCSVRVKIGEFGEYRLHWNVRSIEQDNIIFFTLSPADAAAAKTLGSALARIVYYARYTPGGRTLLYDKAEEALSALRQKVYGETPDKDEDAISPPSPPTLAAMPTDVLAWIKQVRQQATRATSALFHDRIEEAEDGLSLEEALRMLGEIADQEIRVAEHEAGYGSIEDEIRMQIQERIRTAALAAHGARFNARAAEFGVAEITIPTDYEGIEEAGQVGLFGDYQRMRERKASPTPPPPPTPSAAPGELDQALRGTLAVDLPGGFERGRMAIPEPTVYAAPDRDGTFRVYSQERGKPEKVYGAGLTEDAAKALLRKITANTPTKAVLEARYGAAALAPYIDAYLKVMGETEEWWYAAQRAEYEEAQGRKMADAEFAELRERHEARTRDAAYSVLAAIIRKDPPSIKAIFEKRTNPRWYKFATSLLGKNADAVLQEAERADEAFWVVERARRAEAEAAAARAKAEAAFRALRFDVDDTTIDGAAFIEHLRKPGTVFVKHTSPKIAYFVVDANQTLWELDRTQGSALQTIAPDLVQGALKTKGATRFVNRISNVEQSHGYFAKWPTRYNWYDYKDFVPHDERAGTGLVLMLGLTQEDRRRLNRSMQMGLRDPVRIIEVEGTLPPPPPKPESTEDDPDLRHLFGLDR